MTSDSVEEKYTSAQRTSVSKAKWMQVKNSARGTVLADRMEVARSSSERRKGLLGRSRLASGEGIWIIPCESVHTFFMHFAIDLVYLDGQHRVKKLRRNVSPWRISVCFAAKSVLELPVGTIEDTQTQCGDLLEFVPV